MLCGSSVGSGPVLAGEFAYGAGYSLAHDSNITRVPTDPAAEWTQTLYGGFAYRENTADLNARLLAQTEARYFARNTFSDDSGFLMDGSAVWTLLPKQFAWTVEDTFREVRLDLTTADTPANRTDTNTLSTGPDFALRLDTANSVGLGARYGRFDIKGPGDNERYSGHARLLHQISAVTTLSLNYEATHENFEPPALFTRVLREDRFVSYATRESPTNNVTIDVGTTRVVPEGREELSGRLARLSAARQLTSESALRASLAYEISETYRDLLGGLASPTVLGSSVATPDIYRTQRGELSYAVQGGRFGYTLQGYARRIDYEQLDQEDHEEKGGRLAWTWLYSGDVRIQASTEYLRRTFLSLERTDVERNIGVGVTYRLTRNVSVVAEGVRTESESTALGNFVNRRAMLLLAYSTGPLYGVQSRR